MFDRRRLAACVCIAVIVLAGMFPFAPALFAAVLVPVDPLFRPLLAASHVPPSAPAHVLSGHLRVSPSRGPPTGDRS